MILFLGYIAFPTKPAGAYKKHHKLTKKKQQHQVQENQARGTTIGDLGSHH